MTTDPIDYRQQIRERVANTIGEVCKAHKSGRWELAADAVMAVIEPAIRYLQTECVRSTRMGGSAQYILRLLAGEQPEMDRLDIAREDAAAGETNQPKE